MICRRAPWTRGMSEVVGEVGRRQLLHMSRRACTTSIRARKQTPQPSAQSGLSLSLREERTEVLSQCYSQHTRAVLARGPLEQTHAAART